MGLDRDLRQACVYQGLPPCLAKWFKAAIDLDRGLQEFRSQGEARMMYPRRTVDRIPPKRETPSTVPKPRGEDSARRPGFRCFCCNQEGHCMADCPLPPPRSPGLQSPVTRDTTRVRNRPASEWIRLTMQTLPMKNMTLGKDVGGVSEERVGQLPLVAERVMRKHRTIQWWTPGRGPTCRAQPWLATRTFTHTTLLQRFQEGMGTGWLGFGGGGGAGGGTLMDYWWWWNRCEMRGYVADESTSL
ncbi:uncharacterized protein LOC132708934 [Pantherophis guttatus]|uniref:Uncharacterized protein LOC132708934 n=1 Tax=Pantherophis guttatus TaxID=94885 RepID=A0ABM3YU17_PANGU|nr:uncharacterized protein LOC132708934 [Pantherophis guttatus]